MGIQLKLFFRGLSYLDGGKSLLLGVSVSAALGAILAPVTARASGSEKVVFGPPPCFPESLQTPKRSQVYKGFPFGAGEESEYSLSYAGAHVGYGFLRVKKPIRSKVKWWDRQVDEIKTTKIWHMQFQGEAYTGDWYQKIFRGHDVILAYNLPGDMAISRFYMRQKEKALLSDEVHKEKWLVFDHQGCTVDEREINHTRDREKTDGFFLDTGAIDVLGALFRLRTFNYRNGKKERILVYSSEKNWWLEADPLLEETVEVEAGKFLAQKLKLRTYIGKELQQKGDTFLWIAKNHPNRPVVLIEAEVSFGSIALSLDKFKPGKS